MCVGGGGGGGGYGVILELVYAVKGGVSIKVTVNNIPMLKTLCVKHFVMDLSPKLMAQTDQMIGMAIREGQPTSPTQGRQHVYHEYM